jgi:hypothetical protein
LLQKDLTFAVLFQVLRDGSAAVVRAVGRRN